MNTKDLYGKTITGLLEKYRAGKEPLAEKGFFLFEQLKENAMLFIGLNPSEVDFKKYSIYPDEKNGGVHWGMEEFKKEYPRYYKPFDELANGMEWAYLDLFFALETKADVLREAWGKGKEFLKEQLKISGEIIKKLEPKLIVVGNAFAGALIKKQFDCTFCKEIGTYRIRELNKAPIFFSGMFTGQHAVDTGSRERLVWHIGFVKETVSAS
jgi:hypothetical protein